MAQQRYVPIWRDPAYLRAQKARKWIPPWSVLVMSLAAASLLALPGSERYGGYASAISYELRDHNPLAWLLLILMAAILAVHSKTQFKNQRLVSGVAMWAVIAGLATISVTDPHSEFHLTIFVAVALLATAWLILVGLEQDDLGLQLLAVGAGLGMVLCLFFIGIGERVLIAFTLLGLNLVHYRHLPE